MRFLKKIGSAVVAPVTVPASLIKSAITNQLSSAKNIYSAIDKRKTIRHDESVVMQMKYNKDALFKAWGIRNNEQEINRVKRGLTIDAIAFTVIAVIPVAGLITDIHGWMFWFASLTATPLCLFVATTKIWRHECIADGKLTPYRDWLLGGER